MGILSWLSRTDPADLEDKQRIDEAVERVMRLNPQLKLARRYHAKLAPAVGTALRYVVGLVDSVPAARDANAAAWSADPYIHAYFVAPDDVAAVISRSRDLRAYFESNADAPEAFAVLGMEMTERHILGVGLEGDTMRRDVPQTTVSFSDHQVRMCGRTDADLRNEIVQRLLDQLALEGLARIAADKSRREMLQRERALLKTRLQLLERQGNGIRAVLGSEAQAGPEEMARLEAQIEENDRGLSSLVLKEDALDRALDHLCEVYAQPAPHFYLSTRRLRLDRMNVVLEDGNAQAGADLEVHLARIPTTPPRTRAFSLLRFARSDLLPAKSMYDEANRLLSSGLLS
jgi:hypothetical protein